MGICICISIFLKTAWEPIPSKMISRKIHNVIQTMQTAVGNPKGLPKT